MENKQEVTQSQYTESHIQRGNIPPSPTSCREQKHKEGCVPKLKQS